MPARMYYDNDADPAALDGQTVAIMLPTGLGYFFSFLGILQAGGIPVPIYPPARPKIGRASCRERV